MNNQQKKAASDQASSRGRQTMDSSPQGISTTQSVQPPDSQKLFSPLRFLIITIGGIFLAEIAAMMVVYRLQELPYLLQTVIDASIMVIMIFPLVYYFSLKPLLRHIEERRRAEDALQRSEERFAKAFHSSPAALSITRIEDGIFIDVNRSFLHLFGYQREEVIGHTSIELRLYVDAAARVKVIQETVARQLLSEDGVRDHELDARLKSGEIRTVLLSTEGIELDGKACILGSISDITERKRAEEAIERERKRFYDVLETLPAYLILLTPDYHVPFANRYFRERFGESQGKRCYEYLFGRSEPCEICETYKVLDINASTQWEWTGPDSRIYDVFDYPFTDTDGSTMILEMGIDITERKQAEARLRRVNKALMVLSQCNQVLAHAESEDELLKKMCATIVEVGGYRMAWVGYAEQDEAQSVRPVAQAGFEDGYLSQAQISWADSERGRGPTGSAIRTGLLQVNQNFLTNPAMAPWRELASKQDYQSSIALPLKAGDACFGALTIYSQQPDAFDPEEVHQLKELAGDLEFGIQALRDRIERQRAEKQVHEMALFPTLNPDAVLQVDASGQIRKTNPAAIAFGIRAGGLLAEQIPDLMQLDLSTCIAEGTTLQISNTRLGGFDLLWTVRGIPELGLAFLYSTDITEHKKSEKVIRQLSRIVEQTDDTVVVTNRDGVIEYVNPAFERLTGYSRAEALGNTPRVIKSGLHDGDFYQELWSTILSGQAFQGEIANRKKNGEVFYEVKTITPLRNLEGEITHFVATGKDITEHKRDEAQLLKAYDELEIRVQERTDQLRIAISELEDEISIRRRAEDALRQSEQRLNRAQEIAHLGSWELDLHNNSLTWSDEAYRIFGLEPQEFSATYEAFLEAVHPDDRAAVDDAYSGSIREGRDTYEIEHRVIRRSSGEIRFVHEKCEHFREASGQIIRSIGMVHDITERRQAEEALRQARDELELRVQERTQELAVANRDLLKEIAERKEIERQLRIQTTAMEAAANGIIITDCNGTIQWTNPALRQITGYDVPDLLSQNMRIFRSGQHSEEYYRRMWNTIRSGQVWRDEIVNRHKDGSLYVEDQTITPVRDENDQISHFIAIKQDITQRKRAEEELERRNVELQAISSAERKQRQFSEALVEAALVLDKSVKVEEVLALILEEIQGVIPYQFADVTLLDGESFYEGSRQGYLDPSKVQSDLKQHFSLRDFPVLKKIRQSGQPVLIADTQQEPDWVPLNGLTWSRSFLSAPLLAEQRVIGFVNLFADQPGFFTQEMSNHLVAFAAHAAVAIQNAWLFEQVRAGSERLQSLSRRLVEIQESERLYISRELHDEAGQMLTSMMVDLRMLEQNAAQPDVVIGKIAKLESSLNQVLENLHRVAMALRPASLDHVGLVAALRQHVESVGQTHGLKVSFKSGKGLGRLPANVETVLYRIVQEALTNVVRHAHATRVDVVLTIRDDKLIVIVEDDGIGFDPDVSSNGERLGLFGMRERAEMIDGRLVIESAPGKGTTIMMEVQYGDTHSSRR